LDLHINWVI